MCACGFIKPSWEEQKLLDSFWGETLCRDTSSWPVKSICVAPVSYAQQDCPSSLVVALHFHSTLQCRQRRNYSLTMRQWMKNFCPVYAVRPPLRMLYISWRGGREVHFTVSWQSSQAFIFAFYLVISCKNIVTECEMLKEKCGVPRAI